MFVVFPPRSSFEVLAQYVSRLRIFLQRKAPFPIIETQKSHCNVSDVDRRETGLFPEKTMSLVDCFWNAGKIDCLSCYCQKVFFQ